MNQQPTNSLSLSNQKSGASGKKTQKSAGESESGEEEPGADDDEDDEDKHAVEHPPHPNTASWFSDHNYIAVTPEKTPPMSPTVLNKKCMYLLKGLRLMMKPCQCFSVITVFCHGGAIEFLCTNGMNCAYINSFEFCSEM